MYKELKTGNGHAVSKYSHFVIQAGRNAREFSVYIHVLPEVAFCKEIKILESAPVTFIYFTSMIDFYLGVA